MSLQKIEVEVDVPEGYTAIAYRKPQVGELYLDSIGDHVFKATASACNAIIVEKAVIVEKDPPKYREVRKGDEGKPIQVKAGDEWRDCYFIGFLQSGDVAYEDKHFVMKTKPTDCRILDDGEPAKQPREFWLNVYGNMTKCYRYDSKETARRMSNSGVETLHVQVIDESAS